MSFEEHATELLKDEASDVIAIIVLHWPEEDGKSPWADCHGCIPRQHVAGILTALGESLGETAKGMQ